MPQSRWNEYLPIDDEIESTTYNDTDSLLDGSGDDTDDEA